MPRSPAQKEDTQRQRAQVMAMRRTGTSFQAIGDSLGFSRQRAHEIYKEALAGIPLEDVTFYRTEQAERLDALLEQAHEVLAANHVVVQHGKVVMHDGAPLVDRGPVLDAIKTIIDIETRRAKLLGLDTPVKQQLEVDGGLRYEIVGVDVADLS